MKSSLYNWIWKWHFVGGLVSLPFIMLLAITGSIYLFKSAYEAPEKVQLKKIEKTGTRLTLHDQWSIAKSKWTKTPQAIVVPSSSDEATEFTSGRFSHKSSLFVDPYQGSITGQIQQNQTDMHKVRKLHGELLLGSVGTKVVELVASWLVVLLITGIYLFWPRKRGLKGLFTVRIKSGKRILYRDLHGLLGFWFSGLLLLILAGGLPWTDIFGSGYKWVQEETNTGFSTQWKGFIYKSSMQDTPISLDSMMTYAQNLNLPGEVSINLPKDAKGIYSISNQTNKLEEMRMIHIDQYSGQVLYHGTWNDIGIMMRTRLWMMAFHQGQFGAWNLVTVLFTSLSLLFMSITALLSYLKRKKKGSWNVPETPKELNLGTGILVILLLFGMLLPLFGISLFLISLGFFLSRYRKKITYSMN